MCERCDTEKVVLIGAVAAALAALPSEKAEHAGKLGALVQLMAPDSAKTEDEQMAEFMGTTEAANNVEILWMNNTAALIADMMHAIQETLSNVIKDRVRNGNDEGLPAPALAAIRESIVAGDRHVEIMEAIQSGRVQIVGIASGPEVEEARDPRFVH